MVRFALSSFFALIMLVGGGAQAAGLTADQASRFVDSMPAIIELGKALEAEGISDAIQADYTIKPDEPFEPYSYSLREMKKISPDGYSRTAAIAKDNGFANAEEWASVGDQVVVAYMALKMPPDFAESVSSISEDMLVNMPPELQAQMAQGLALAKVMQNVPQATKDAVAPVADRLDAIMDDAIKQNQGGVAQ